MTRFTRRIRIICLTVLVLAVILPVLFYYRHSIGMWLTDYGHGLPLMLLCASTGGLLLFLIVFAFLWLLGITEDDTTSVELICHTLGILMVGGLGVGWWHLAMLIDWTGTPFAWVLLLTLPLAVCVLLSRLYEHAFDSEPEVKSDTRSWRDRLADQIIRFAKDHIAGDRDESKETDDGR